MSFLNNISRLFNPATYSSVPVGSVEKLPIQTASQVSGNPFLGQDKVDSSIYGKNKPVPGGYFAGYYNGQPNIVGQKLFIVI
jgi:hypothetical protein